MSKNIVAVCGAYPDIGKGIFASSLAYLIQENGISVSPIKFDGYLNYSSGTMNPYHGKIDSSYSEEEVFVLKDGHEGDADSGYYERFLHQEFDEKSNISNGKLFAMLSNREKSGELRHGEVLNYRVLRNILEELVLKEAKKTNILFVEIGGTIGDKDNEILFDSLNLIKAQQKSNVFTIMISPYLSKTTEQGTELSYRSKITRQAFEKVWRMGLMPNAIVMRIAGAQNVVANDLEYIGLETGLSKTDDLYLDPDMESIYELPELLSKQNIDTKVLTYFGLKQDRTKRTGRIEEYTAKLLQIKRNKNVMKLGIFGKSVSDDTYLSLIEAVDHASVANDVKVDVMWLDDSIDYIKDLDGIDGLIVGESLRFIQEKLHALEHARNTQLPTLAFSFGFDLFIKEYFENELKKKLNIDEIESIGAKCQIIKNTLIVGNRDIDLVKSDHYRAGTYRERFRTNSALNMHAVMLLENSSDLNVVGVDSKSKQPVVVEHAKLPFYIGVKFHPEFISHPMYPHQLINKLIQTMKKGQIC